MAEVNLINVTKYYEAKAPAVSDVNLEIKDKEFVVLVGPSGCGKSTTLRMIAGLEEATSGEIYIDGKFVNNVPPKDRDIAMVFQNYALYPHMSVYDNMAFGLKLRKFAKSEIKHRVHEAANILGINELLNRKPKALSGGQRQRVAVGRAIVRHPKVFLFDEPLSNLDAKLRVQMRTEISKLHEKLGVTMIYVTHDQTEAMTMGDKIVVMKDGIIHQTDAPLNLYNNPANKFVAGFIGSPAMNFIDGLLLREDGITFISEQKSVSIKIPERYLNALQKYINKKVTLGIRPEDIHGKDESGKAAVKSVLEVVEPMGNEIFIYFSLDGIQFVGRIPADRIPQTGTAVTLYFNLDKLHFFDVETGGVIR
jgi:multiple sugar transport system ATP-binding protein